ncbi:MAG TPA: glycosyltransferase [Candidatus Excrementavichristensenella intestinipullorum]|nr:glycosyltransferase [Candidatus Excrementavichristensenella intestinipullorum]
MDISQVWVLIPAYKPEKGMLKLLEALPQQGFAPERLLVVDDGGGAQYAPLFEAARAMKAVVLTHEKNRGKGAALKTGIAYVLERGAAPVVTCDADGQHAPEDIRRVAQAALENPEALVLGVRDKKQMPPKSKAGNSLTCFFLGALTGLWIQDTQTGLRALPVQALTQYLNLEGERYEYETAVLIAARRARTPVVQVVIHTLYFDQNAGSHFRPLRDGWLIYRLLLGQMGRYLGSSALAGVVDLGLFVLLRQVVPRQIAYLHLADGALGRALGALLPQDIGVPALIARAVSSLLNYFVNKDVVFRRHAGKRSLLYYYLLVAGVLLCGIQITSGLSRLGMNPVAAKVIADGVMFAASYQVQQRIVFRSRRP